MSQLLSVRGILRLVDRLGEHDAIDNQIMIDVRIDQDTNKIAPNYPIFGLYGSPERDDAYPFILKKDGVVDYGKWADWAECSGQRQEHINVRDKCFTPGEVVTYFDSDGEEWTYVIRSCELLAN